MKYYTIKTPELIAMGPQKEPGLAFQWKEAVGPFDVDHVYYSVPWFKEDPDIEDLNTLPNVICVSGSQICCDSCTKAMLDGLCITSPEWQCVPAIVCNRKGISRHGYWHLNCVQRYEPLDRANSIFTTFVGRSDLVFQVTKWVLDRDRIPPLQLFYSEGGRILATEILKNTFEAGNISGCVFERVCDTQVQ